MRALRLAYLAVLGVVIVWLVATRWSEVTELASGARPVLLVASLAASFGMIFIGSWFWVVGLASLDVRAGFGEITIATSRSLLARYLPGSVWFAVGRVALLRRGGLPGGPLAATALLEMALTLATVLAFGFALLGLTDALPGGIGWLVVAIVALVVGTSPPIGGRVLAWLAAKRNATLKLTWPGYWKLLGVATIFWAWSSLTFGLYLRAFPVGDQVGSLLLAGGFLVSWGIGFLAVVAPQGVGVFEVGLATLYGIEAIASFAVVAGGYRLVVLARDLMAVAGAELIATRRGDRGSVRTE